MGKRVWDLSAISVWRNEEICYMSEGLQQKLRTQVGIFETVVQGTVPSVSLKDRIPLRIIGTGTLVHSSGPVNLSL